MDALEAIFTRRSIRKYTGEPVTADELKTILEAGMNAPSANNSQPWHFIVVDEREKLNAIMKVHPYSRMLAEAPLAIVVCGDPSISKFWQQDCAAATENLLLAARALGLGTVWLGVYPDEQRAKGVAALFGVPEHVKPMCIIAVGHPAEQKGRVERYNEGKVHKNGW
ncbi:MAG TPA: nitroreductase family protein [Anaerolineae bacterium]|mgnify:CR=1 FL=1|nr:nitroreductase family protein [Anaerolineae bacterium]HQI85694.1 nitroreductase family protein [Anaerolineae bacterium]